LFLDQLCNVCIIINSWAFFLKLAVAGGSEREGLLCVVLTAMRRPLAQNILTLQQK